MRKEQRSISKYNVRTDYSGNGVEIRKKGMDIAHDVSEMLKGGWVLIWDADDFMIFEREENQIK